MTLANIETLSYLHTACLLTDTYLEWLNVRALTLYCEFCKSGDPGILRGDIAGGHLTLPGAIIYPQVDGVKGETAVTTLHVAHHLILAIKHSHWLACLAPPTFSHLVVYHTGQSCA